MTEFENAIKSARYFWITEYINGKNTVNAMVRIEALNAVMKAWGYNPELTGDDVLRRVSGIDGKGDTPTSVPLMVEASGDPDYPFCVCPVDSDGIQLPPVAQFVKHADALRFVSLNQPIDAIWGIVAA